MCEVVFYDRNLTRILGGVPITSLLFPGAQFAATNAFDNNTGTICAMQTIAPVSFIGYDFLVPREIAFIKCDRERNNNNIRFGYQVDFSDDGINWFFTGYEVLPLPPGANTEAVIIPAQDFENIDGFVSNKWSVLFLSAQDVSKGNNISTAEVAFTVNETDVTIGGSGAGSTPSFVSAFDKNPATFFASNNTDAFPYFVSYYFDDPVAVDGVEITSRLDAFAAGNFKHIIITAFDSLAEIDVAIYGVFNQPAWALGEKRIFNFGAPAVAGVNNVAESVERFKAFPWISLFITEKD